MPIQTLNISRECRNILNSPAIPLSSPSVWGFLSGDGNSTEAGELISWESSLQISTVFSAVRILAESISSLPVRLYRMTSQGRMVDTCHPLANLLGFEANPDMSACDWLEVLVSHLSITGNSFTQIQRGADGSPVALWPLSPRKTAPVRLPSGAIAYKTSDGETGGNSRIIAGTDILHVRLTSWDGILGMSPVMQAKRSLGLAVAAEKYGARVFANGGVPQIALTSNLVIKPEDKAKMRQDWEALQTDFNQHRVAVLDNDLKIEKLSILPEEAQFLETRKYTRADIAALFRVPSHMLGELQKLSNSNTEQMNISFVVDTLRPLISKIEGEFSRKLLPRNPGQPSEVQISFDVSERLRGDSAAQAAWATAGRNGGWLTANDIRRSMGLNAAGPELDQYISPINYENSLRLLDGPKPDVKEGTNV